MREEDHKNSRPEISAVRHPQHLHPTVVQYLNNHTIASEYDECFKDNNLFKFDCEVLKQELPAGGRILDAGCGTGRHLLFLERNGFEGYGLDLSPHFLQIARKKLQCAGLPARLRQADILYPPADLLPPPLRYHGIILMFSVLGMVQGATNRRDVLFALKKWLEPNGVLVAHVHNRQFSASLIMEKLQRLKGIIPRLHGLEEGDRIIKNYRGLQDLYLHTFTLRELRELLHSAELRIRSLIPLNSFRDGVCKDRNVTGSANGFIVVAH